MSVPDFKHGSVNFLNKQKNLFDILNAVDKEIKRDELCCDRSAILNALDNEIKPAESRWDNSDEFMKVEQKFRKWKRRGTKQFRGQESLFKVPIDVALKFKARKLPDFQRNPDKWIKYSFADVTEDDMSEETNIATALSFLHEIKMQKQLACMETKSDDKPECKPAPLNSHKFNLPLAEQNLKNEPIIVDGTSCRPTYKSSKLIMPEYVVGQKTVKKRKCGKEIVREKGKEIYLNHIHEYDDE